ncbi:MAG: TolC family protein [Prevotella sp.]|nr:TolC family protein [Prevotella sp.]
MNRILIITLTLTLTLLRSSWCSGAERNLRSAGAQASEVQSTPQTSNLQPQSSLVLSLDSCRARALRANKQISIAKVKQQIATNARKVARTKYLPHVDLTGGYLYSSREISLLNDAQKGALGNIGTTTAGVMGQLAGDIGANLQKMAQAGIISPTIAKDLGTLAQNVGPAVSQSVEAYGNKLGQRVVDAFSTNTHHIFTASAMLVQPVFMGGSIIAMNKIADISERMASTSIDSKENDVTFAVENAYWTVVSLKQKQRLADEYLQLVEKLDDDVHKMIKEGVATRADGLKVRVAVNEAEMAMTMVDNGLSLAKMYLCKQCGMELDTDIVLEDELKDDINMSITEVSDDDDFQNRHELKLLNDAIDISKQQTKIARAAYLPQIALTGGAIFSNPSVYNGFERKFKGALNVGVMMRIPVLDWGDNLYKIRATKCATTLAQLEYSDASDLIRLQVSQSRFKVREAGKNLELAKKNILSAEENLRCANLGFKEGVMSTTDVMMAQTAWLKAKTQKIDAEIEMKLSGIALEKALGKKL